LALADVTEHVADHAMLALAPELQPARKISFKAGKKGDSVMAVAQRYRVAAAQVASWNNTNVAGHFKPGQVVVVMVVKPAAKPAVRVAVSNSGAKRLSQPAAPARTGVAQN